MNFTSQICTSREQSERLLALGLKKETADMYYFWVGGNEYRLKVDVDNNPLKYNMDKTFIPAWSLHRLIEMMPIVIEYNGNEYDLILKHTCIYEYYNESKGIIVNIGNSNIYESTIILIEWLIKEGFFNKEYLEEL